jgi:haloalkane dehalogenase
MSATPVRKIEAGGMTLGYRELGSGPPVLLLHGWPTSSFLWRGVIGPIARHNRVVALDLPGFGASDKPEADYGFEFFEGAIDGFLAALEIDQVGLAVHDLGGPIGLHWALRRPARVTKLALLNTLVYPEFSEAVLQFLRACTAPESREFLTSPAGLEAAMRLGVADDRNLTEEVLAAVREPFRGGDSRRALADAGIGLDPEGFVEIARLLPSLRIPVRIVYGEQDPILPDIADTVARVKRDLPQAEVTALPGCGHFLQEEAPEEIGELLAVFFADQELGKAATRKGRD